MKIAQSSASMEIICPTFEEEYTDPPQSSRRLVPPQTTKVGVMLCTITVTLIKKKLIINYCRFAILPQLLYAGK